MRGQAPVSHYAVKTAGLTPQKLVHSEKQSTQRYGRNIRFAKRIF